MDRCDRLVSRHCQLAHLLTWKASASGLVKLRVDRKVATNELNWLARAASATSATLPRCSTFVPRGSSVACMVGGA